VRVGEIAVAIASGAATVSKDRVEARRGTVKITGLDGRAIAGLSAGQSWTPPALAVEKPRTKGRAPSPVPEPPPTLAERLRLAEQAQIAGKLELAIERYTDVATAFPGAAEAESALYAAARLEVRLGRAARAKSLLEAYLARYPRGRYVDDVRRELTLIR
jgi:hypothetical protein